MKPQRHPSTDKAFREAHVRFTALQKHRDAAMSAMWAGMLAGNFSDFELDLLADMMSPEDHRLLRNVGRAQRNCKWEAFAITPRKKLGSVRP